jgi:hypothetical protein
MVHPQVVDTGDGLQIWRVAVNVLNKESCTADRNSTSSLGVGQGPSNTHRKKILHVANYLQGPRNGWILWHYLSMGK